MNEGTAVSGSSCTYLELDYFYWALESGSLCPQPWSLILTIDIAYGEVLLAVRQRYPKAAIDGLSVQKMVRPGVEVIVGMTKDAQFGPVLMFGLGGILVEVLKDVSFRIVPLERETLGK